VRDVRLRKAREQKNRKRAAESIDECEKRLAREQEYKRTMHNSKEIQPRQEAPGQNQIDTDNSVRHVRSSATNISEDEHRNSVPKWIGLNINFVPYVTNESH